MRTSRNATGRRSSSFKRAAERMRAAIERIEPRVLYAAFQPGDLVVYRVGTGSAALSSASTAVYLDEYTPTGTLVQSIALPTSASGGNNPLTASGTATSEGNLTLSADGQKLVLTGYDATTGVASIASSTATAAPREVGIVSADGSVNATTTLGTALGGNNIRGAAADGNGNVWAAGANGAVYTTLGSTANATSLSTSNLRSIEISNGQLYAAASTGATALLGTLGTGLPTSGGPYTVTQLPGIVGSGTSGQGLGGAYEFAFATLNPGDTSPDTLYVADNYNDGVDKFSLVNGSWALNGEIGAYGSGGNVLAGVTGVAAEPVPGGEQLFISSAGSSGSKGTIYTITDPYGYNSAGGTDGTQGGGVFSGTPPLTVVANASTNEAFRGIAFVPQPGGAPTMFTQPASQTAVNGTNATFTAAAYGTNVSVQWQVSTDGGNTYSPISGATFTTLTVPASASANGYEYEAVFTNGSGSVTSSPATLTVIPGPAFQFSASTLATPNTDSTVTITVNRFGDSSVQDTVQYATSDGTAKAGTNYTAANGTLTFPAGATSETFTVPVTYVASQSGGLTFDVTLSNLQGSNAGNAVIGSPLTVTINPPFESLGLSSGTYIVNDSDGTDIFSVVRGGSYSSDAGTVPFTVTGAVSASGTVSFAAGQQVSAISVPLPAANGGNQTFTITLGSGITGFTSGGAVLGSQASATVTDVHAAGTNLSGLAGSVTDIQTGGPYSQSYAPVVGDAAAGSGSFANVAYEVLEFSPSTAPSLYPTPGTTVNANGVSSLSLQLFNTDASGADNYSGHAGNFSVYFLPDTDTTTPTSKLTFSTSSTPSGLASNQFKSAPVLLGTFSFNNTAGYDAYTPASIPSSVVSALVSDLNSGANFRLAVTPGSYGSGAIAADWRGVFSGQTPTLSLAAAQTVKQTPESFAFQSSGYTVNETAGTATITLARSGSNLSDTATVNYATSDGTATAGTNYTTASGTATFAAGSATATFTIPITDVPYQGGDKTLNLSISSPATGNPSATVAVLGSPTTATLTIVDANPAPTETLTSNIVDAGDIEAGGPYDDTELKATAVSGDYPSYSAVDFTESTPTKPVTAIDSITMTLVNEATVAAGPVDFYLVSDNTSNILPGSPQSKNPHFYDSTQGVEGFGTQFGTAMLLGSYNLTDTTGGDTLIVPLTNYTPATASALISYLNSGSVFRILVTPENNTVDADWVAGSAAITINVQEGGPAPTVTALSPASGPAAGGTSVTISGSHFTGATGVEFGTKAATSFTVNSDGSITATAPAASGAVDVTVINAGGVSPTSPADQFTYTVTITPPTLVGAPVINGDNPNGLYNAAGQTTPGTQRSMVEDIVYTFNEPVTIANANQAFTLAVAGPAGGTLPTTLYAQAVANSNGTQWAVSLTGMPEGTIGSIANGEYSITINPASVFAAADGVTSMAPGTGRTDNFYRLYGDVFGTRNVNNADYNLFKKSINTYNPMFDDFGTGTTSSNADYNVFKKDLNISYYGDGFVTSI